MFTLAGLLVITGLQMRVLGPTGSVNLPFESWLVRFCQTAFLAPATSWAIVALVVAGYAAGRGCRPGAPACAPSCPSRRCGRSSPGSSRSRPCCRVVVAYLGTNRGVGAVFALFVGLVALTDLMLRRTRWGRSVRAVGGDAEAARKAGVPVRRVFVSAFVACSTLAALGGVLAVGRLAAANQGSGAGDTNLTAIAAAVIGGTSLFGGRGRRGRRWWASSSSSRSRPGSPCSTSTSPPAWSSPAWSWRSRSRSTRCSAGRARPERRTARSRSPAGPCARAVSRASRAPR